MSERMTSVSERPDLQRATGDLPVQTRGEQGIVRWFSPEKGYGFIVPDGGGDDLFVRFSAIVSDGFRRLDGGQRVSFARSDDDRGPRAIDVHIL